MQTLRPDPTFYPSPKLAMEALRKTTRTSSCYRPTDRSPMRSGSWTSHPFEDVRHRRPYGHDAQQGRRVPPFRLERLQPRPVALNTTVPEAPVPRHS